MHHPSGNFPTRSLIYLAALWSKGLLFSFPLGGGGSSFGRIVCFYQQHSRQQLKDNSIRGVHRSCTAPSKGRTSTLIYPVTEPYAVDKENAARLRTLQRRDCRTTSRILRFLPHPLVSKKRAPREMV